MEKPSFDKRACDVVHFEFEAGLKDDQQPKEIEIYLGGYFLTSMDIEDLSKEAREIIFN